MGDLRTAVLNDQSNKALSVRSTDFANRMKSDSVLLVLSIAWPPYATSMFLIIYVQSSYRRFGVTRRVAVAAVANYPINL